MNKAVNDFFDKKAKSVKFLKEGDGVKGQIVKIHDREPQTEFGTTKEIPGKEQVRIDIQTDERDPEDAGDNGIRTLYCKNQLAFSCGKAFTEAGVQGPEVGGHIEAYWTSTAAPSTPGLNGAKRYSVVYSAPSATISTNGSSTAPEGIDPVAWASMPDEMKAKLASK